MDKKNGKKKTGINESLMQENGAEDSQSLASERQSSKLEPGDLSTSLSKNVCLKLYGIMKSAPKNEAADINAICNCASQIHNFLKLNYQMKKDGF